VIRRAHHAQIHTGWFIESLATQTLVLLVIRTTGNPFRSKPSLALLATVIVIVLIGALLPFRPLAPRLGFTPLPAGFFVFLLAATTYLLLVEMAKRPLVRRFFA